MYFFVRLGLRDLSSADVLSNMETRSSSDLLIPGSGQTLPSKCYLSWNNTQRGKGHLVMLSQGALEDALPCVSCVSWWKSLRFPIFSRKTKMSELSVKGKTPSRPCSHVCAQFSSFGSVCARKALLRKSLLFFLHGDLVLKNNFN